jgi:hypothetical protein
MLEEGKMIMRGRSCKERQLPELPDIGEDGLREKRMVYESM